MLCLLRANLDPAHTRLPPRSNAPSFPASELVRAGARFDKGVMIERPDEFQEDAA